MSSHSDRIEHASRARNFPPAFGEIRIVWKDAKTPPEATPIPVKVPIGVGGR